MKNKETIPDLTVKDIELIDRAIDDVDDYYLVNSIGDDGNFYEDVLDWYKRAKREYLKKENSKSNLDSDK